MKKMISFALLLFVYIGLSAQNSYQYVLIPTHFAEIGDGFNPHGISSAIQKVFNEKSIRNSFLSEDAPEDFCEALKVNLINTSNMFKHRLRVELKDCRNKTVWEGEGAGTSKAFNEGLAEAFADAVKNLSQLPANTTAAVAATERRITPKPEIKPTVPVQAKNEEIYVPANLYYNYTYFADLIEAEDGAKHLILLNGELLGYKNLQNIATLKLSGIGDVYTVNWVNTDGSTSTGVANLTTNELKIAITGEQGQTIITLQKY